MSKSLGNFVTINELLETQKFGGQEWDGQVLRLAMLRTHYRQPIDWTQQSLVDAEQALDSWIASIKSVEPSTLSEEMIEYLSDDMNTHLAMTELYRLYRQKKLGELAASLNFLGFDPKSYRSGVRRAVEKAFDEVEIKGLINSRLAARTVKDWKESDRIRDELATMGVSIKDNKDGTTSWEVKR